MKRFEVSPGLWEIPVTEKKGMRVPARIIASRELIDTMDEGVFNQVTNVACLPGIVRHALCMPDGHWGYGFPIGGVAAFDLKEGVISPGGIGFDINCGMRLLRTNLLLEEVEPKLEKLMDTLFQLIPAGVGCKGFLKLDKKEFSEAVGEGVPWVIRKGYGWENDLEFIEQGGGLPGARPDKISEKALSRGMEQLGTLGSGNHYLEVQVVKEENVYDWGTAKKFGVEFPNQIVIMVHCGSRGFGHQVATDYLQVFDKAMPKYGITVLDRELGCAPFDSPEGRDYHGAMLCAANAAFSNRQVITHRIREGFSKVFGKTAEEMEMRIVYDVAHNIAKVEEYEVNGKPKKLLVHRKGATRSFGPGEQDIPAAYRDAGQPVIVGGSMETGSYLLAGTQKAHELTFGSTLHGSGRTMSRTAAKKKVHGKQLQEDMRRRGILVKTVSYSGLAEEAGLAYKDIAAVVEAVHQVGISRKVARLKPIGNIKG